MNPSPTWSLAKLGDVLKLKYGKSLPAKSRAIGAVPVYGSNGLVGTHDQALTNAPAIIVGRKGSVGEVVYSTSACWPIDTTYFVDEFEHQHPRFWYYALRFLDLSSLNRATAIPGLNREDAYALEVPVPPLAEQKRIADKLDRLLASVDTCKARLDAIPAILKRFRQSVLAAATSGELTEEWRSNNGATSTRLICIGKDEFNVPEAWDRYPLSELVDPDRPLCYGVVQPGAEAPGGIPLIRVQDLENGTVNERGLRTVSEAVDQEFRRSRVRPGDVLVSVVGTIGRIAVVPEGTNANIARAIARVACRPSVLPAWMKIWLSSDALQWWLLRNAREVARKTLNLSDLATLRIALPSLEEQQHIAQHVEALFSTADELECMVNAARERIGNLTQSVLASAFGGALVRQGSNINSAGKTGEHTPMLSSGKPNALVVAPAG